MPEVIVKGGAAEEIEFFGKVDRKKDGTIASTAPAWYLRTHKEELENDISRDKKMLELEVVDASERPSYRANLKAKEEKLDAINASQPKYNGAKQDVLKSVADSLGAKISESMFTRTEMQKGLADAHEEAHRMADPIIKVSREEAILAEKAGCRIENGKISRNDAERVWKYSRRALGEMSNSEMLRRQQ